MKFSVCIPNYNYAKYVGRTIESVLRQTYADFEIIVSDNASTDGSTDVVRGFADPRIKMTVNRCNVGFAGNLDRAARQATGDVMILLSSDDMMHPEALATYARVVRDLRVASDRVVICSSVDFVDADDRRTDVYELPRHDLYRDAELISGDSASNLPPIYRVPAQTLLKRSLEKLCNPFFFCATAYSRKLYESIEGYGGSRLIGPDKWFNWRLLAAADEVLFIRKPLFCYRWHPQNQTAQQAESGALKYLIDSYSSTFELSAELLAKVGLDRLQIQKAFIEYDVVRPALAMTAAGKRRLARRTLNFGKAAYPGLVTGNLRAWALRSLLLGGAAGTFVANILRKCVRNTN